MCDGDYFAILGVDREATAYEIRRAWERTRLELMKERFAPSVRDELSGKLRTAGFGVIHVEYFNLAGVPGWWLAGRVLRRRLIPTGALRWYDALVPLFRLERFLPWRIGQSLIAIGEVPA